jgi:hypothetical protein
MLMVVVILKYQPIEEFSILPGNLNEEEKMKNRSVYSILVLMIIASLAACAAPSTPIAPPPMPTTQPPAPTTPPPTPTIPPPSKFVPTPTPGPFEGMLVIDKLTSKALEGNLMGNPVEREFLVYLPPDYATSDKRYPVAYMLHGAGSNDYYSVIPVKNASKKLLENGEAKEIIFVFPDASNKIIGSMYMSSITNGDFETYITKELVEKVDSTYRTIPNRDSRAISGCSMGGMGSMHLGFKYPDVYGVVVPMNGLQLYEPFNDLEWESELSSFSNIIRSYSTLARSDFAWLASQAMIASPNPDNPPFYFDMPYKVENGKTIIDPEVYRKIQKLTVTNDINSYLAQPIRLNNLYIFTSDENKEEPYPTIFTEFDKYLTEKGIQHDFTMFPGPHCVYDYSPVIKYLSDHLVFE